MADANLRFYREEHGFDASFAGAVNAALDLLESRISQASSRYLVVVSGERPVGCIFLSAEAPAVARIRLFYLDEAHRRQGIGKRLLRTVLNAARENEIKTIRVSTFDRHFEACRLYESFGFEPTGTTALTAFGQVMKQVDYELLLER